MYVNLDNACLKVLLAIRDGKTKYGCSAIKAFSQNIATHPAEPFKQGAIQ